MPRINQYIYNGFRLITILFFFNHFLLTIIYVFPMNPIKIRLQPLLDRTIGTVFSQNWSLFAPNPVGQDYILLIQPLKTEDKTQLIGTKWFNLSSPFWSRFHDNRFSAYDRLARSQSNALRNAISGDPRLINYLKACEKGDTLSCRIYKESLEYIRDGQIQKLARIGSAFCNDINSAGNRFKYFALRIRVVSFSSWSKRYESKKTVHDLDLGMFPIDTKVASVGLFY